MNDTDDSTRGAAAPVDDDVVGPLAGQRLAAARRASDISIAEIAKELHLDEIKVQALEENQFDVLGAPVFAKGHLRKYAELVGVSMDDILADYYKLNRSAGAPPLVAIMHRPPSRISLGPWIVGLAFILVVGGIVYWWISRDASSELLQTPGALEPFADRETSAGMSSENDESIIDPGETPAIDVPELLDETASAQTGMAPAPPAAAPTSAEAEPGSTNQAGPLADGQLRMVLTFSGDCWTEVTDVDGKRVFFGLGQAGQTVTRTGKAPFHALFGDRFNVSVSINGKDLALQGDGRRGNTARVTIKSP